jgi:hypothetical protein
VHLQLQNLCKVSEDGKDSLIRQALASLPKGLHNTYARISQQIMDQLDYRRSLGIRCLRWVLYAQRPLDVTELQYALATFDEGDNAKDFELDDLDVILGACANLVVAQEEGGYTNDFWLRTIVRPIHYSVQEYFASDGQSLHSPITKLPIGNRMDANARLAADCLAHFYQPMMLSEVSDQFESIDHTGCWLPHDAFLHYAARNLIRICSRLIQTWLVGTLIDCSKAIRSFFAIYSTSGPCGKRNGSSGDRELQVPKIGNCTQVRLKSGLHHHLWPQQTSDFSRDWNVSIYPKKD